MGCLKNDSRMERASQGGAGGGTVLGRPVSTAAPRPPPQGGRPHREPDRGLKFSFLFPLLNRRGGWEAEGSR